MNVIAVYAPTTVDLNGIPARELETATEAIEEDAASGKIQFRARSQWHRGGYSRTVIKEFAVAGREDTSRRKAFILASDEPKVLLGNDDAPDPSEFVLHAVASCLITSIAYHASNRNIALRRLEIEIEGDLDLRGFLGLADDVRPGFDGLRIAVIMKADASREALEELCRYAQARSPVLDVLAHPVPVTVSLTS